MDPMTTPKKRYRLTPLAERDTQVNDLFSVFEAAAATTAHRHP
ncbi:hypothetical protein MCA1255 [Methylococcus capsulatus str. Bath]|uniref:Uncharacterized protein n=1 Tax=Methylococcus capsulatus (strain ATCC 33009 / NCIMB 11132 / Bath) TaxID=243233 RepID=Q609H9_METCA|nr:hypothetical protein MCA1255 [Methylococcus capsulatus str. Bath]